METAQPGILSPMPRLARYLTLDVRPEAPASEVRAALERLPIDEGRVLGLGAALADALGGSIAELRAFPCHAVRGVEVPSTPAALLCWLRGDDRGDLVHRTRAFTQSLSTWFEVRSVIDAFQYRDSRDLTGYEDGTENPTGARAAEVAFAPDGSSFVAVQQWVHDLDRFEAMSQTDQDLTIGRRRSDNEEIADAPPSAHVKRTAQEDFEPEAFVLRRSMPWADGDREGLVFVAFGRSFDAFEAQLARMVGEDDGITDALFRFTRPITGHYFWCPPVANGRLNLARLG